MSADDIAAVAAAGLLDPRSHASASYDVVGPEALTMSQVAATISETVGRTVTHVDVDRDAWLQQTVASGLPADYAGMLASLLDGIRGGGGACPNGTVKDVLGRAPESFKEFADRSWTVRDPTGLPDGRRAGAGRWASVPGRRTIASGSASCACRCLRQYGQEPGRGGTPRALPGRYLHWCGPFAGGVLRATNARSPAWRDRGIVSGQRWRFGRATTQLVLTKSTPPVGVGHREVGRRQPRSRRGPFCRPGHRCRTGDQRREDDVPPLLAPPELTVVGSTTGTPASASSSPSRTWQPPTPRRASAPIRQEAIEAAGIRPHFPDFSAVSGSDDSFLCGRSDHVEPARPT